MYEIHDSGGFEPYYIGLRDYPLFDEVMVGCGRDKVVHFDELMTARYSVHVLPDIFIIHLDSTGMGSAWCRNMGSDFPKDEAVHDRIDSEWRSPSSYKADPLVWWDAAQSRLQITNELQSSSHPSPPLEQSHPYLPEDKLHSMSKEELVDQLKQIQAVLQKIISERETLQRVNELQYWNLKYLMFFVFVVISGLTSFFWRRRRYVFWTVSGLLLLFMILSFVLI